MVKAWGEDGMLRRWQRILLTTAVMAGVSAPVRVGAELANLPVVESAALVVGMQVPWSRPVWVRDPFEGRPWGCLTGTSSVGGTFHG